jgi:hypothetical protein
MKMKAIKPLKEKGFKKTSLKKKPLRYAVTPPWMVGASGMIETRTTSKPLPTKWTKRT